jgi:hypothetical protein
MARATPFILGLLAAVALAYFALKPHSEHKSVALEAEHGASQPANPPNIAIGEAAPLTPPTRMTPPPQADATEPSGQPVAIRATPANAIPATAQGDSINPQPDPAGVPDKSSVNPQAEEGQPVAARPEAVGASGNSGPPPAPDIQPDGKAVADINRRVEVLQALVERLERTGRVLASRLDGLELVNEQARPALASDGADGAPPGATGRPAPTPKKARRKPAALRPAAARPRQAAHSRQPLPFQVESVDVWNGQKTVVIRQNGQLIDVRPGERRAGWRIDSADGQAVTLSDPSGSTRTVMVGEGGRP